MLDNNIKTQLKAYFEKIVAPITLTASLDQGDASAQMLELLNEVAEQSDKITVKTGGQAKMYRALLSAKPVRMHALLLLAYQWAMR